MIDKEFWKGKRVFLTGHTGFKGSWMSLWLHKLGAKVTGYSLAPATEPNMYEQCAVEDYVSRSIMADLSEADLLKEELVKAKPDVIIHMAAQAIVREGYNDPVGTYMTNVMGSVNLLDAARFSSTTKAILMITTDKCYENKEWHWGYRETDRLGGFDPYSSSKACAEILTSAYRSSFFNPNDYDQHGVALASARAGNVIGGGDWAKDRLIPDCVRALQEKQDIVIRSPKATRPWQYVLEPLSGYLLLSQKLYSEGPAYVGAWNFGPEDDSAKPVDWIVRHMIKKWDNGANLVIDQENNPHEARYLKLDCSKAKAELGWHPKWNIEKTIDSIIELMQNPNQGSTLAKAYMKQIEEFSQ